MKKWDVSVPIVGWVSVTVEAADEQAAIEAGHEVAEDFLATVEGSDVGPAKLAVIEVGPMLDVEVDAVKR